MWTFLAIVAAVLVTLAVVNRQALMQMFGGARVQTGSADALAHYQEKVDGAAETLRHARTGLDRCRTVMSSLQRQIADGEREVARLDVRIKSALSEGNEEKATEYVQQLEGSKAAVEENKKQLSANQEIYASLLKQVRGAQDRIVQAKRDGDSLGKQLQTSQAEADLTDITQSLTSDPNLSTLDADREAVLQQIDANRAKAETAHDLDAVQLSERENEERSRQVEAKALLDQYKASSKDGPSPDSRRGTSGA